MKFWKFLREGVYDPNIFKAIFLAGGVGSGKSYVVGKTTLGHGLKLINSDIVFEKMLKDAGLSTTIEDIFSKTGQEIRQKAKDVLQKKESNFIKHRLGLIIDGTGKNYEKIKKQSDKLKDLGYDTFMIFVNTSLEVAQQRNLQRIRTLDPKLVEKAWMDVQSNIGKFQNYFGNDNFIIVDNNQGTEDVFNKVWKRVMKLVNKKPENKIAKEWIKKELEKKEIK